MTDHINEPIDLNGRKARAAGLTLYQGKQGSLFVTIREGEASISMHLHLPGDVPRALHFNVADSRAIAAAFLDAAETVERELPRRCICGEPVDTVDELCFACDLAIRKDRRATLKPLT